MSLLAPPPAYSEPFCNREYNARASIPNHLELSQAWRNRSTAIRGELADVQWDCQYGPSPEEKLDFFPSTDPSGPLMMFIHGGYWRALDKADFTWIAPPYLARGISVAVINYGLAPKVPIEEIVRQCLRASTWLWTHHRNLSFDRRRMVVTGHSAGGHLTAMMLAARWKSWNKRLPDQIFRAGLAVSGLFDLEPIRHASFLNVDLNLTVERVAHLSPLYMPCPQRTPILTAVGGLESSEFLRQSRELALAWAPAFGGHVSMPGENHLTVCGRLADPHSPLYRAAANLCLLPP